MEPTKVQLVQKDTQVVFREAEIELDGKIDQEDEAWVTLHLFDDIAQKDQYILVADGKKYSAVQLRNIIQKETGKKLRFAESLIKNVTERTTINALEGAQKQLPNQEELAAAGITDSSLLERSDKAYEALSYLLMDRWSHRFIVGPVGGPIGISKPPSVDIGGGPVIDIRPDSPARKTNNAK